MQPSAGRFGVCLSIDSTIRNRESYSSPRNEYNRGEWRLGNNFCRWRGHRLGRLSHRPPLNISGGDPKSFVRNGLVGLALVARGEQVKLRLAPAPVLSQSLQQGWTERQITIFAAFALYYADDHALAIDVADLDASDFAASHAGAIQRHQQ